MPAPQRRKIAILGGGVGSMAAAFGLTENPRWNDEYEITVYQLGWRLGGKGASGRNRAVSNRIEEHGLHVWGGFYENAFWVMQRCYEALGRDPRAPLATWRDAFKKHSFVVLEENVGDKWIPWCIDVPENSETPGTGGEFPGLAAYVQEMIEWMQREFARSPHATDGAPPSGVLPEHPSWLAQLLEKVQSPVHPHPHVRFLHHAEHLAAEAAARAVRSAGDFREHHRGILWLLEAFMTWFGARVEHTVETHDETRRLWILLDMLYVTSKGILVDGVVEHGFDIIDDVEWSDWMRKHGASPLTLDSAPVRGIYDYIFGYRDGDLAQPAVGAGTCLRGVMRLVLTYKGAIFWEMQAGMGDTVFAPLYQVLKKRGVRFEFFRNVRRMELSADKGSIARVTLGRQVNLKNGTYDPLFDVGGLPCWPSTPLYEQIVEGDRLQKEDIDLESAWTPWQDVGEDVLECGRDFDQVVLGISIAALPGICRELIEASPRWQKMVDSVETVQTQAMQLWLTPDAAGLGWKQPTALLTSYAQCLNTWGDLSHLLARESWPAGKAPKNASYLCGPLQDARSIPPHSDPRFPAAQNERVIAAARAWLEANARDLWPDAVPPGQPNGLDPSLVVSQYHRANVNPTDRYVLSVPGSAAHRLPAGDTDFDNLVVTGDWVRTSINAGCVEAATMSGLQASRKLCGFPKTIIGEEHP